MPEVTLGGQTFSYEAGQKGNKWFYHPDGRAKLAYSSEEKEMYAQGFCDTPDDFDKVSETEVEEQKHDLNDWDKDKIVDYAFTVFGVKLKKNFSKANLIKQVEELENGNIQATD